VTAILLIIHDRMLARRQEKTMLSQRTSNLVSSMFCSVRDRLTKMLLQQDEVAESFHD
jgi:hypothetical protein